MDVFVVFVFTFGEYENIFFFSSFREKEKKCFLEKNVSFFQKNKKNFYRKMTIFKKNAIIKKRNGDMAEW
jgi:hypothetical protein